MPEPESQARYPMERLDRTIRVWFLVAQDAANRRGSRYLTTGLILMAAGTSKTVFAERLLAALRLRTSARLVQAFDAEWESSQPFFHDEPVTAVKESILKSAGEGESDQLVSPEAFVATMLDFPSGMASKVLKRLGVDPSDAARRLRSGIAREPSP
jgi:hypothetical protein